MKAKSATQKHLRSVTGAVGHQSLVIDREGGLTVKSMARMADAESGSHHMASAMTQAERDHTFTGGGPGSSEQQRNFRNPVLRSELQQVK